MCHASVGLLSFNHSLTAASLDQQVFRLFFSIAVFAHYRVSQPRCVRSHHPLVPLPAPLCQLNLSLLPPRCLASGDIAPGTLRLLSCYGFTYKCITGFCPIRLFALLLPVIDRARLLGTGAAEPIILPSRAYLVKTKSMTKIHRYFACYICLYSV